MSHTIVVRLSWVKYIGPLIRLSLFGGAAFLYLSSLDAIRVWAAGQTSSPAGADGDLVLVPALFLLLGVFGALWSIWLNKTVVLKIGPDGVEYRSGILPWKKTEQYWRYSQIFSTRYANTPEFLGWLLRFGDLIIVGREGSTHEYRIAGLHNPRRAQMLIANRSAP